MENLRFIIMCVIVIAAIFGAALLAEKHLSRDRKAFSDTHYVTYTAIFACMAGVLMLFELPLFFAPGFYKLDISEMPVLICTFYLGPVAGVTAELVKVMVKLLLKGTSTAFVGDFANFVVGCSFVLPASIIYHAKPGRRTALIGMVVGTLVLTVFGSLFNGIYLIPKFVELYGIPLDAIVGMGTAVNAGITSVATLVVFAVVPFNLLKGVVVSALTFLLYKRISPILHKNDAKRAARLEKEKNAGQGTPKKACARSQRFQHAPQPRYAQNKIQQLSEIYDADVRRQRIARQQPPYEQQPRQRVEDVYPHAPHLLPQPL